MCMNGPLENPLEEFHQSKWIQYFGTLDDLPQDADITEVRSTMNEILSDMRVYPCDTCRENVNGHLSNMAERGHKFTDAETKKEAIERLCEFKNEINKIKGNPEFSCELVIKNGYEPKI